MLRFDDYRCANNNTNQYELLVSSEKRKLFNIANSIAWEFYKSNSTFTFDEIQSTAYMGLVKGLNSYNVNKGKKLTSWIYSKVKWEILSMFEKEKKLKDISLFEADDSIYSLEERLGAEEFEEDLLNHVLIKRALTALNSEEIKIIYYKFYEGQSYSEIANKTKLSISTIGVKVPKILEKMRNKLNEGEINNKHLIPVCKKRVRKIESINTTKEYIVIRTKAEAQYLIENQSTLRKTAKAFGVSKATVHRDLTERLPKLDKVLYDKVCLILDYNFDDKHYRGGEAFKRKCKEKTHNLTDQSKSYEQ